MRTIEVQCEVGTITILVDLAKSVGLSKQEAQSILETRAFKNAVDSDWSRSLKVDPEYIPSLLLNGHLLVNPQKYELIEQFVVQNDVKKGNAGRYI